MIFISSNYCLSWRKTTTTAVCFLIGKNSKIIVVVGLLEELTRGQIQGRKDDKENESERLAMNAELISLYNWKETKGNCGDRM